MVFMLYFKLIILYWRKTMIEFHVENLLLNLIIFAAGTYVLIKGSDLFIESSSEIARFWRVSELVIGLTLVSIGTSLPELATSVYAQITRESDFVIGNIAGSITTNITLVLGAAALIGGRMAFSKSLLKRDAVIMNGIFLATAAMFFLFKVEAKNPADGLVYGINRVCGAILFIGMIVYIVYLMKFSGENDQEVEPRADGRERTTGLLFREFGILAVGLVMIVAGSKAMVDTVVWGAEKCNISSMIISATIVAFGTSIPELAVTIAGVVKKKNDLAIGNIIGSCTFNILMIFGVCGVIGPLGINSGTAGVVNTLLIIPVGLAMMLFMATGRQAITRFGGAVLFTMYLIFIGYNVFSAIK